MSRIGKMPIKVPKEVTIDLNGTKLIVKGKFGQLQRKIPKIFTVNYNNGTLLLTLKDKIRRNQALYGLYRTLLNNMVIGVSQQFELILTLQGVGYRAIVKENSIILNLGYSHVIQIEIPKSMSIDVIQNTTIKLKSCDKERLGRFASQIRTWRPPEPYKGKGILYEGETIRRKAGKSGKK